MGDIANDWLTSKKIKYRFTGIGYRHHGSHGDSLLSELWAHQASPIRVAQKHYRIEGIGSEEERSRLRNGLWLCLDEGQAFTIAFEFRRDNEGEVIYLEATSTAGQEEYIRRLTEDICIEFMKRD